MQDLSSLVRLTSLSPSSQAATNTISSNTSMTAPGTVSESTRGETPGDPAASVTGAHSQARTTLQHGEPGGQADGSWTILGRHTWP